MLKKHEKTSGIFHISLYEIFCGIYIAHKLLPFVGEAMPAVVYLALFCMVFALSFLGILGKKKGDSIIQLVPYFLLSIVAFFMYILRAEFENAALHVYSELQIFVFGMIVINVSVHPEKYSISRLLKFVLLCYAITSITTIIGCIRFPTASRILATVGNTDPRYHEYSIANIGGFAFCYEITLLIPLLMSLIKEKKINALAGTVLVLLFVSATYVTEYTMALVFSVIAVVICLLSGKKRSRYAAVIFFVAFVLLYLLRNEISVLLLELSNRIDSEILSFRFSELAEGIRKIGQDADYFSDAYRVKLYYQSWQTILSTRGLGAWTGLGIGGHSYILDNLATYGILGLVCIAVFYNTCRKNNLSPYKNEAKYWNLTWMFIMLLAFAVLNPKSNLYSIIFLTPLYLANFRKTEVKSDETTLDRQ